MTDVFLQQQSLRNIVFQGRKSQLPFIQPSLKHTLFSLLFLNCYLQIKVLSLKKKRIKTDHIFLQNQFSTYFFFAENPHASTDFTPQSMYFFLQKKIEGDQGQNEVQMCSTVSHCGKTIPFKQRQRLGNARKGTCFCPQTISLNRRVIIFRLRWAYLPFVTVSTVEENVEQEGVHVLPKVQ